MIETQAGAFYTGISTDVQRRFAEHKAVADGHGRKGAKYFRRDVPLKIIFMESFYDRSSASRREYQIKSMTRKQKERLVAIGKIDGFSAA